MELDQLIKQLSSDTRDIFESAVGLAANRSHFDVDIAHWLLAALNTEHQDMSVALQATNPDKLRVSLDQWMESRQTGCDGYPKIHHDLVRLLFDAWMLASSEFQALQVRPAHMLLAMVEGQAIRARLQRIHPGWSALTGQPLRQWLTETQVNPAPTLGTSNQGSALARFTQNLSALVQAGKIDAVVGRNEEVRQMIDVLARHKQNNPILVGEAGVGKTAVVEGLAVQIANGQVPTSLQNVALHSVDLGLLQAGASVKGEFENRLKNLIKEVQTSPTPIVLFIDEAHTLIGAGQAAGQGDAANLLKPALARGELRTIAATTWSEYKQYIENDAALTRRFQVIQIDEPDEQRAIMMLGSLVERLQKHHEVRILHEAVVAAVALSKRYLNGRQLPDKCVSVLDTACARVNLSLQAIPASLERLQSEQNQLIAQFKRLQNEVAQGFALSSSLTTLKEQKNDVEKQTEAEAQRWKEAQTLLRQLGELRSSLEGDALCEADRKAILSKIKETRANLNTLHDGRSLVYECVDEQVVADVISDWTGIPVGQMRRNDLERVLSLPTELGKRVLGQNPAIQTIAQTLRNAQAKLNDPSRPLAVFMLVGPSGVGKTETALALAEQLYGGEQQLTVLNMSEFKESHKVSLLMGSPPGYKDSDKGGLLTEAVRRKPHSVVLLDELEKANPAVHDVFYQVFDKGLLRDSQGRDVDFKQTVLLMTCNTASEEIEALCADPETAPEAEALLEAIQPALRKHFSPAFLGRVTVVPYYPLGVDTLADIAHQQLAKVSQRVKHQYQVPIHFDDKVVQAIVSQCQQSDTGARMVAARLNKHLLPHLSEALLSALANQEAFECVRVTLDKHNQWQIDLTQPAG